MTDRSEPKNPEAQTPSATRGFDSPSPASDSDHVAPLGVFHSDDAVRKQSAGMTRRSMLVMGAGAAAGAGLYYYLNLDPPTKDGAQPGLLRDAFVFNQHLSQGLTGDHVLAPTYPLWRATELRYNAANGCKEALDPAKYRILLWASRIRSRLALAIPTT